LNHPVRDASVALFALVLLLAGCAAHADPRIPLASGQYQFQHRFAEHPTLPSIRVDVAIDGDRIVVSNAVAADPFPSGVLAEGQLVWHPGSKQWIIADEASDRDAFDVGGCSDGPEVVDLENRIYWTC
jgi:hypothetical protein